MGNRRKHVTPAGWHDTESAAELLSISKIKLLKLLRENGWLQIDKKQGIRGGIHNMPKRELIEKGLLSTQDRTHGMRGEFKQIGKFYSVALIKSDALSDIRKMITGDYTMQQQQPAQPRPTPPPSNARPAAITNKKQANAEREACLQQLHDMGIDINRAS